MPRPNVNPATPTQGQDYPTHPQDLRLAREYLGGSPDAGEALANRMRCIPRMLAARNRRVGRQLSEHDLADLAQDTAAAILKKLPSFEGRASLETWFHRFCGFEFANAVRRSSRRSTTMSTIDDLPEPAEDRDSTSSERAAGVTGIERLLRHLSAREADVVRLRHVDEVETLAEIASMLGVSVSSVKTHYYRALEKLRVVLVTANRAGQEAQP